MINVLLVDDHKIVRHGLKIMLEADPDITVLGECENGKDALEALYTVKPDVVIMDISMPVMDGTTAAHQILKFYPDIKVLVLSMHQESSRIKEMAALGVSGFLAKNAAPEELIRAVKAVYSGQFYLQSDVAAAAYRDLVTTPEKKSPLTERELDVVRLAAQGISMADVAKILYISPRTAQTHLYRAMKKLGMHSRHELVLYAIREGLIISPE